MVFTYILEVVLSLFAPANAVQSHIGGSVLPGGSEAFLSNLWKLQVLWGRNHIYRGDGGKIVVISITMRPFATMSLW